jgi:Ca2+-binding EF-hand superfamily protein
LFVIEYAQAFTLFDRDEDGFINSKELSILIRSLEHNPSDNEIQHLIDQFVDTGLFSRLNLHLKIHCFLLGNNLIDCNQFLMIMSILEKTRDSDVRKELREIFNAIDTDNNGLIDSEELRTAMRIFTIAHDDMKLTKEEVDEMIAEIDGDKDGRLTFEGNRINYFDDIIIIDSLYLEFASIFAG